MTDNGVTRIVSTQEFREEIETIRHQISSIESYQQEIRHTVSQLDKHIRMLDDELNLPALVAFANRRHVTLLCDRGVT